MNIDLIAVSEPSQRATNSKRARQGGWFDTRASRSLGLAALALFHGKRRASRDLQGEDARVALILPVSRERTLHALATAAKMHAMEQQMIAVVDGSRARYFSVGTRVTPKGIEKNKLVEVETLINPANRMKDGELFSDSRPGIQAAFAGGPAHGVDDKRDAHHDEADRKFAKLVLEKMAELIREHDITTAILAAGPKMLGHLRDNRQLLPHIDIGELPKHLTELSPHELCLRLEATGLL